MTAQKHPQQIGFAGFPARFKISRQLGQGGMGSVFEAYDEERGHRVALKKLDSSTPAALMRFKHEFRALAGLTHPNLVALYELTTSEGAWFFTMEIVEGKTFVEYVRGDTADPVIVSGTRSVDISETITSAGLSDLVDPATGAVSSPPPFEPGLKIPLDVERLRAVVIQLARGLHALHSAGHLHRDVKPSNVLVTEAGRVVILDFGIISALGGSRDTQLVLGTPAYAAPELVLGGSLGPSFDWYSLGVVIFQCLVGALPFKGPPELLFAGKVQFDAPDPREIWSDLPEDLAGLAHDLLKRKPQDRPDFDEIMRRIKSTNREVVSFPRSTAGSDHAELVGREREFQVLKRAYGRLAAGQPATVLVEGNSGMGKTAMIETFLDKISTDHRTLILRSRCFERESVPFKAVDSLVDALAAHLAELGPMTVRILRPPDPGPLARVFPVLAPYIIARGTASTSDEGVQTIRRAFAALTNIFERLATLSPLVLFIDDIHWGDAKSAPFLLSLTGAVQLPIMVIASYRAEERDTSELLAALRRGWQDAAQTSTGPTSDVSELKLEAVDNASLATLAKRLTAGQVEDEAVIDAIVEDAGGHPYYVHELALHYMRHGLSQGSAKTLDSLIRARVDELNSTGKLLVKMAAVAGWPLPLSIATAAAGSPKDFAGAMVELVNGRLLRTTGPLLHDTMQTYHDRVREALAAGLDQDQRQSLHARLCLALRASPNREDYLYALATHGFEAGDKLEAKSVLDDNITAGDKALTAYAFEEAYTYFGHAKTVAAAAGLPLGAHFHRRMATAAKGSWRNAEALALYRLSISEATDARTRAEAHLGEADIFVSRLENELASDACASALDATGEPRPSHRVWYTIRSLLALVPGVISLWRADRGRAEVVSEKQTEIDVLHANIYFTLGHAAYYLMDRLMNVLLLFRLLRPISRMGQRAEAAEYWGCAATVAGVLGRKDWVLRCSERGVKIAEAVGDPSVMGGVLIHSAHGKSFAGDPVGAVVSLRTALQAYGDTVGNVEFVGAVSDFAWNRMLQGHLEDGWHWLQQALERSAASLSDDRLTQGHTFRCYAGIYETMLGRVDEGQAHFASFREVIEVRQHDRWRWSAYIAHSLLAAVEIGRWGEPEEEQVAQFEGLGLKPRATGQPLRHAYLATARGRLLQLTRRLQSDQKRLTRRELAPLRRSLKQLRVVATSPLLRGHELTVRASLARLLGQRRNAELQLKEAEHIAEANDAPWIHFEVLLERAHWALADGLSKQSSSLIRMALDLAERHRWALRQQRAAEMLSMRS